MKTLALLARLARQRLDEKRVGLFELIEQSKRLEINIHYLNNYLDQESKVVEGKPEYQTQFYFFRRNIDDRCFVLKNNQAILQGRLQTLQDEMSAIFQEKKSYEIVLQNRKIEQQKKHLKEEQKVIDEAASNQFDLAHKRSKALCYG